MYELIENMSNLVLIGYRCTGKTTVGKHLADKLHMQHVDADEALEQKSHRTIRDIFAEDGEATFRELEVEIIAELMRRSSTVISLGGGAVLREENRQAIADTPTVWLRANVDTIWQRMHEDSTTSQRRPALTDRDGYQEIVDLLAQREPLYRATATLSVDTEQKSPDQLADEIVDLLKEHGFSS